MPSSARPAQQQEVGGGAAPDRLAGTEQRRPAPVAIAQASAAQTAAGSAAACFWTSAKT